MAALRLLAVYFVAAGGSLLLVRKLVSPLRAAPAAFLLLGPLLLTGHAMRTAGVYAPLDLTYNDYPLAARRGEEGIGPNQNPTLGDVIFQEIPFRAAAREALFHGRLPLWNRFLLAGEPLLAAQQPQVLHPTTWIGLLLPLSSAWTFEMAFRAFLALLAAYLFFRDVGCGEWPSLLGAAGWAFSDYIVFYSGYPLTTAAAPFPLLLLGLRRLARDADRRALGLTVAALLLIVTAGHPESLLHSVAGAGVFFLFDLAAAAPRRRLRALGLSLAAGVLTLGLAAILLLPFWEAAQHTMEFIFRNAWYAVHAPRAITVPGAVERLTKSVVPYAFGEYGKGRSNAEFIEPAAYAGALLFPLLILGLGARRREKWPLFLTGIAGVAAWIKMPGFADRLAKLPLFDVALNERLVFLGAFGIAGLAALGADRIEREPERAGPRLAAASLGTLALLAWLNFQVWGRVEAIGMKAEDLRSHVFAQVLPLAAALAVAWGLRHRLRGVAAVAILLALLLVQRRFEEGPVYPTFRKEVFYPHLPVLDAIPRHEPWRSTAVGFNFIPNISAIYGLEDVRGYEAMTFLPLVETFPLWCVSQPVWYNRVDDPTRPFLSFLNVRYVFLPPDRAAPPGWKVLSEDATGRVVENPRVLPRAFVPRFFVRDADRERQIWHLNAIRDFADGGVVEGPDEKPRKNGEASVRIGEYAAERLVLEIDAKEPAIVGTSMTRWPGWRLELDGRDHPLLHYNRAFLGFETPPGRHRAVLTYWPRSITVGLWVSGLSLLAAAAVFGRRRSSTAAPNESAAMAATGEKVLAADQRIQSAGSPTGSE